MNRRSFLTAVGCTVVTGLLGSARTQAGLEPRVSDVVFELGPLQFFEDHDTRGDSRYPSVRQPRV